MELFVPGRICLMGEHSDWAGGYRRVNPEIEKGYALIVGTNQGVYADVGPHANALVLTATTPDEQTAFRQIPMQRQALLAEAQAGGFWSYVAGVAYLMLTRYGVGGLVINNHKTDLPIQKGLSSSAAICVLVARAFNRVYDLGLSIADEMELAYQGEILTPSRCGRMDQGCAFGNRPILMTFDGDDLDITPLGIAAELHFVIVDLLAHKDTLKILADLNRCYPVARTHVARGVHQLLGAVNKHIIHKAVEALQAGDGRAVGKLMTKAQVAFDRYAIPACPEELTAPKLHQVLRYEPLQAHIWGGKGVGSQGDGTAQFIARSAADQQALVSIIQRDLHLPCLTLTVQPSLERQP